MLKHLKLTRSKTYNFILSSYCTVRYFNKITDKSNSNLRSPATKVLAALCRRSCNDHWCFSAYYTNDRYRYL